MSHTEVCEGLKNKNRVPLEACCQQWGVKRLFQLGSEMHRVGGGGWLGTVQPTLKSAVSAHRVRDSPQNHCNLLQITRQ